jgi:excisionase family DNA binding protein
MYRFTQFSAILNIFQGELMEKVLEPALTVREVAFYLNVDEKTIYRLVIKGELPGFKVLGSWRFQRLDLETWISERKDQAAGKQNN